MKAWRVDRRINNVKLNEPSLGEPIKEDASLPGKPSQPQKTERKSKVDANGQLDMFGE